MNDDRGPEGGWGGGKTFQGVKTKSRLCRWPRGLPSC